MVTIKHDWDDEDYVKTLQTAYAEYRKACYGVCDLPPAQIHETKQAFMSGMLWLSTRDSYCPDDIQDALRTILGKDNPFIKRTGS